MARRLNTYLRIGSVQNTSGQSIYVIGVKFDKMRVDPRITARTSSTVENGGSFEFSFLSDGQESAKIEWRFEDEEDARVTSRNILRRD